MCNLTTHGTTQTKIIEHPVDPARQTSLEEKNVEEEEKSPLIVPPTSPKKKEKGWFERIALMIDEYCCCSYTTRQMFQETNDTLCSNLCYTYPMHHQPHLLHYHYHQQHPEDPNHLHLNPAICNQLRGNSSVPPQNWNPCTKRFNGGIGWTSPPKLGGVVPLHIVKEDCIYYSKSYEEQMSPANQNNGSNDFQRLELEPSEQCSSRRGNLSRADTSYLINQQQYCSSLFDCIPYEDGEEEEKETKQWDV